MIFLPNIWERYLSALRIAVNFSVSRHGLSRHHINSLKKIYKAEAVLISQPRPIDLRDFSLNLMLAVYKKLLSENKLILPLIYCEGVFIINKKLFEVLILNICSLSNIIKIYNHKEKIAIKCNCDVRNFAFLIKALGGAYLYELKTNFSLIFIPAKQSQKLPVKTEREWEYTDNPFSSVNLFI